MMISTTQKVIQTTVHPVIKRYRVDHLDLHTSRLAGTCYVEWILNGTKSLDQNAGAFVFSNGNSTEVYPRESKQQVS